MKTDNIKNQKNCNKILIVCMAAIMCIVGKAYADCKKVLEDADICTKAGSLASTQSTPDGCWIKTWWNQTTYSDRCVDCYSYGETTATGKTGCDLDRLSGSAYQGTVTEKESHMVPKLGCEIFKTTPNKSASWTCKKGQLTGDVCTCPPAL